MSQNIPVRFVRADGKTIQLPVTTITLDEIGRASCRERV